MAFLYLLCSAVVSLLAASPHFGVPAAATARFGATTATDGCGAPDANTAANAAARMGGGQPVQGHSVSAGVHGFSNNGRVPVVDGQRVVMETVRQRGR